MQHDVKAHTAAQGHAATVYNMIRLMPTIYIITKVRTMWVCMYFMLCYVMLCYVMSCYVMLCYVMFCYAMLCNAMLCNAMQCNAM